MQVRTAAGVTEAVARSAHRQRLIDATRLTQDDVVLLRVAAALMTAPLPLDGRSRVEHERDLARRNDLAMRIARDSVARREGPGAHLVVFADEVSPASSLIEVMGLLEKRPGAPVLLLPIGAWIAKDLTAMPVAS